jgi:folate-binding protein YgfZ
MADGSEAVTRADATRSEYEAVRRHAGLLDRGDSGVVEVTRRDRATFLHAMLSNDVTALAPGQGCTATLLDVHGRVQVILAVWVLPDRILLVTPPGMAEKVVEMLDRYLFAEKVSLRDATGETAFVVLAGPETPALVSRLAGVALPDAAWSHREGSLGGTAVRVVRGGDETGEVEAWLVGSAGDGPRLRQAALAAGARAIGPAAEESLRIEAGTPRFGADADPSVLLPEIPAAHLLSHTKGCYPGQEVVVRIRDRGHVNRHLRGLVLEGERVPSRGAEVTVDGASAGHVTSAAWSFALERPVALAFVRRQHAADGTSVTVRIDESAVGAAVSDLPFRR